MKQNNRLERILALLDERSFVSVGELSQFLDVSEMTIRRDLEKLEAENRIQRTFGGATSLRAASPVNELEQAGAEPKPEVRSLDQVNVLIATSVSPYYDSLLVDLASKKNIPIIAESIEMPSQRTIVAVDNYEAGHDLGKWAGNYLCEEGVSKAHLLDLTFHQPNTQERSRGFIDGLNETCPSFELALSINSQSRLATSYQLVSDALTVYPQINLIFAINDITALGAINACHDLKIDPSKITIITFGLEGETLKNELMDGGYCKAGLAMFPEIVSLTCIEAAIAAYNNQSLPGKYITPHVILTKKSLPDYYDKTPAGWQLKWEKALQDLKIPIQIEREKHIATNHLPRQIGLVIPFVEHEWYKNLAEMLKAYAGQYGIGLIAVDAEQNMRDEVELRRQQIASKAAALVNPGDVILVDGGPVSLYLAEELKQKTGITVITNSVVVFNTLNPTPGITLISTGGAVRYTTQVMVGPTAEGALKELRGDKLFLMVSGISLDFGLSHHTISEVTMKQAMIRSARSVILLADHTTFGAEAVSQIAPLTAVQTLITDDALPPSARLDISKLGIQLILV